MTIPGVLYRLFFRFHFWKEENLAFVDSRPKSKKGRKTEIQGKIKSAFIFTLIPPYIFITYIVISFNRVKENSISPRKVSSEKSGMVFIYAITFFLLNINGPAS
jgi:hypothetical protein